MKILLTGKNGQVGYELQRSLAPLGQVIATGRSDLDLTWSDEIREVIDTHTPDLIVNAAAYTAVDRAEEEEALSRKINAEAPTVMANEAAKRNIPLVHFSTDYVFNGKKDRPWLEIDTPNPLSIYGITKLAGEKGIQQSGCKHLILRTSWVYGYRGRNFLNTMLSLAEERDELSVVDDQVGSPTWSRHIADVTAQILAVSQCEPGAFWREHSGLYHLTGSGQTSWHGFARAIFYFLAEQGQSVPLLRAISSEQYPTAAVRPAYSCLDNGKLKEHFDLQLPDWRDTLGLVMQE